MTADDFEDRLRAAMDAGVAAADEDAGGAAVGDRRALVVRTDRRRRRQRRAGAAAAVLVVAAAATAGWTVGRDDRRPVEQVTVRTTAAAAPEEDGEVIVSDDPLPVVERPEDTFLRMPSSGFTAPSASVFVRTLPDGTIIGVRGNTYGPQAPDDQAPRSDVPPWWEEPDWCRAAGDVLIEALLPETTGRLTGQRWEAVRPGAVAADVTLVGAPDREPTWLALVQAPAGATTVRATFPGGEADEMAPVDGLAALVAPAAAGVDLDPLDGADDRATVTALAADGSEVGRVEVDWVVLERVEAWGVDMDGPSDDCAVPVTLPPPGPEQPADPAAAEAAVRATWDAAFGDPAGGDPSGDLFEDPSGLDVAAQALRERQGEVLEGVTVPLDGVVFADAETAYVTYTVNVPALDIVYDHRFAVLVLDDGTWKVTRDSTCALLSIGSGPLCPPL